MSEIVREQQLINQEPPLDTSPEQVHEHPKFLDTLLGLLSEQGTVENGVPVVHVGETFSERSIIQPGDTLVIGVKDFHNLARYDATSSTRAGKPGQFGTCGEDKQKNYGVLASITVGPSLARSGIVSDEILHRENILSQPLCSPLDWLTIENSTYVVSEEGLTRLSANGQSKTFDSPLLRRAHSVAPLDSKHLLITATETDHVIVFDIQTQTFVDKISAWELGIQTSFGIAEEDGRPLRRINAFSGRPLSEYHTLLRDRHGFQVVYFDNDNPFPHQGLRTRHQSAHFNSAITHPDGSLLVTAFATSDFSPETGERLDQGGTGGSVIKISARDNAAKVVGGLTNPHNLIWLGQRSGANYFMLPNTGTGRVLLFEDSDTDRWTAVGELAFDTLPQSRFRDSEWLQQVVPIVAENNLYLVGCDSGRRGVHLLSLRDRSRQFIRTSDKAVVHRAAYSPKSSANVAPAFRQSFIEDEVGDQSREVFIEPEQVEEYERRMGRVSLRHFFGYPVSEALREGYKMSRKGFFEAVHGQIILSTAETLSKLVNERADDPRILDAFTGTGHAAWAFAKAGFLVASTELHKGTHQYASHNISTANMSSRVQLLNENCLSHMEERAGRRQSYDAVYLDPPWNGNYMHDAARPFTLSDMMPSGSILLEAALKISDCVALKVPPNISQKEILAEGKRLNCQVIIQSHWLSKSDSLPRKTVYFVAQKEGVIYEDVRYDQT